MKIRMLSTGKTEDFETGYATRLIHMGKAVAEEAEETQKPGTEDGAEAKAAAEKPGSRKK